MRPVVSRAQEMFRVVFEVPTLADAELYGSKPVAVLERQHPRDIFDVQHMSWTYGGLRDDCVTAFDEVSLSRLGSPAFVSATPRKRVVTVKSDSSSSVRRKINSFPAIQRDHSLRSNTSTGLFFASRT